LNRDLTGPLAHLQGGLPPFNLVTHQHYNPKTSPNTTLSPA